MDQLLSQVVMLFAEVHGPQLLKDAVVDVIPCLAHAFGLHTSNIVMHCQGTLPDTASISVAEAGFTDGHTLTMW